VASTLIVSKKMKVMIEKQSINGRDVWLQIEPYHIHRENPNIIPTEYFTAKYYLDEPQPEAANGELFMDEEGETKLFESPVAALSFANKKLGSIV
jgi:hypothetical protein